MNPYPGAKSSFRQRVMNGLSTYIPIRGFLDSDGHPTYSSGHDQEDIKLMSRNREKSYAWVQGQFVHVRTASSSQAGTLNQHGGEPIVREIVCTFSSPQQKPQEETSFRGYGIGGAGNIRTHFAPSGLETEAERTGRLTNRYIGSHSQVPKPAPVSLRSGIFRWRRRSRKGLRTNPTSKSDFVQFG
jgi:hypothetical protein